MFNGQNDSAIIARPLQVGETSAYNFICDYESSATNNFVFLGGSFARSIDILHN